MALALIRSMGGNTGESLWMSATVGLVGCIWLLLSCTGEVGEPDGETAGDDAINYYQATLSLADDEVGVAGGDDIGLGLQDKYTVKLGSPAPAQGQLEIDVAGGCEIAFGPHDEINTGTHLERTLFPGETRMDFWVHANSGAACARRSH
jgi:hypothetical protein